MTARRKTQVTVRPLEEADFAAITEMGRKHYPKDSPWTSEHLRSHRRVFADGQLVAQTDDGRIVGYAASLVLFWDDYTFDQDWNTFTDGGYFTNHDPVRGRTLYGADVMVDPTLRGQGIGKALYKARFDLCRRLQLRRIRAGARLVGYHQHATTLSPQAYVMQVIARQLGDPTLSFQLKQGFRVIAVTHHYLHHDERSCGHAAVIEWINHQVARRADYARRDPLYARHRSPASAQPPRPASPAGSRAMDPRPHG